MCTGNLSYLLRPTWSWQSHAAERSPPKEVCCGCAFSPALKKVLVDYFGGVLAPAATLLFRLCLPVTPKHGHDSSDISPPPLPSDRSWQCAQRCPSPGTVNCWSLDNAPVFQAPWPYMPTIVLGRFSSNSTCISSGLEQLSSSARPTTAVPIWMVCHNFASALSTTSCAYHFLHSF